MGRFFTQNVLFIHFSYEYRPFLIHSKIHSIVQQKYSFKKNSFKKKAEHSFKENIHSKVFLIIHSMKIFIFLKNAVPPTPSWWWIGRLVQDWLLIDGLVLDWKWIG